AHVPSHNNIIKEVDGIIVHSEYSKQYAIDQLGYHPNRVFVIPMGCGPVLADDKDPTDFTLGFFGFCYYHKGLHKLIKSFKELKDKYPKLRLKIVSSKPVQDSQGYFEYCSQLFRELNSKQAEWIQEYKTNEEVLKHLQQTTMVILPYDDYGSVGTSAAVRMAFQALRPVLVSNACWFDELDHFIAPRIDHDLTSSIERFLSGYSFDLWKKTIAQYAYDTSWEKVVQKHRDLYDKFR
ncbi:MAG TPA: glycosyltransferase, partial [Nitrosopumilaceae archaeon]|nr:glycosyltransferase [Nitrosopumilaceae archaeon]